MSSKIKCDSCGAMIAFQPMVKKLNGLEFGFIKCPECEAVFPSYVKNKVVRRRIQEIEKLRQKREKLVQRLRAGNIEHDKYMEEWTQLFEKEHSLIEENQAEIKRLTNQNLETFRKWGHLYQATK